MSEYLEFYRKVDPASIQAGRNVYVKVSILIDDFNAALEHYGFVKERTCKADYRSGGYGIGGWYCSECGGYMHDDMQQDMCYCPNCGAKVVK